MDNVRHAIKGSAGVANDILGKILTLDTALIGGGVVIAKGEVFPVWWSALVMAPLLVSLGCALAGLWPKARKVNTSSLGDVMQFQDDGNEQVYRKTDAMRLSAFLLCVGLFLALLGVTLNSMGAFPERASALKTEPTHSAQTAR